MPIQQTQTQKRPRAALSKGAARDMQTAPYRRADLSVLTAAGLRREVVWLTWLGLWWERLAQAFWPLGTALLMLVSLWHFAGGVWSQPLIFMTLLVAAVALVAFGLGVRAFVMPRRADVVARIDATLSGQPLLALIDSPVVGGQDAASAALWQAHQDRMRSQIVDARAVAAKPSLAERDPYALRLHVLLFLAMTVIAAPSDVRGPAAGTATAAIASTSWEGWIEPPAYTRLPTLYLSDQPDGDLAVPVGSTLILRVYNDDGSISAAQDLATPGAGSGDSDVALPDGLREEHLVVMRSGTLAIAAPSANGRRWQITALVDQPPTLTRNAAVETDFDGQMTLSFAATDDYGVTTGMAEVQLDHAALDQIPPEHRYGLALPPEQDTVWRGDLPMPVRDGWQDFEQDWVEDFSQHPWAHLPVKIILSVSDAQGQQAQADALHVALPARRFFDPLAASLIEMRRDLLWNRANAPRVAQIIRAITWQPEPKLFPQEGQYLQLRTILRQLEAGLDNVDRRLTDDRRDELAGALWDLAIELEDGDLDSARDRMLQAQERLSEAMRNGASDTEIAELMQELRDATRDYMRQLSQQAARDADADEDRNSGDDESEAMQLEMADLQAMMDRIQELMQQGRMAEAAQALQELQELIDNLQVAEGQPQSGEGQQALEQLGDTLREQQGLSDQTFRQLQEQFNPGANAGQSQQNEGRNGGQGRGQSHEGQGGEGQSDREGAGEGGADGSQPGRGSLPARQRALRDELNRQLNGLPGQGTTEGEAARDALRQAERAMDGAEESLRRDDLAGAIDQQAEALEQMREGLRNLGEALAQNEGQGQQQGRAGEGSDPLGRGAGQGRDTDALHGERLNQRAQELQDQINRRSGETDRPIDERQYLDRLLDRF